MLSRTKILVSAIVAGASLAAAVPASAQNYPQQRYDQRNDNGRYENNRFNGNANAISQQIQQLQARVNRTDGRDRISEREADGLRREVANLRLQFRSFNRNGLNQREARTLQDRIQSVRSRLQYERRDRDGRRG